MKKVLLLCGGGHAKCVIDAMRLGGRYSPAGVLDVRARVGEMVSGVKITGADKDLELFFKRGSRFCFVALGSTGDPSKRISLWSQAEKAGYKFPSIIHPSAIISPNCSIGRGVYIGPGAILNSGATIGDGCIINSGAIVEHDCQIGEFVHIAPRAVLSGGVVVGPRSHIGTGSSVTHYISIDADCVIGTGSVVIKSLRSAGVYIGNPARKIKNR